MKHILRSNRFRQCGNRCLLNKLFLSKPGFAMAMKNVRDVGFSLKRRGKEGSGHPIPGCRPKHSSPRFAFLATAFFLVATL